MKISILHFSDLHYDQKHISKIEQIRDKLIENVLRENENVDLVVFSGDLVQKPSSEALDASFKNFIKPIIEKLGIDINNVSITCGNHDIDVTNRDNILFTGFKEHIIKKNDQNIIKDIYLEKRPILESEAFMQFVKNLKQTTSKSINPFCSVSKIEIQNISFGIVSFNSSFFMEGSKTDFGNLWFISEALLLAAQEINDCTIKAVNIHHSFNWFKNSKELEKLLLDKFNIVFFGHEHEHDGKHILDFNNRDILSLHASAIYQPSNQPNGYCIYTYDLDEEKIYIKKSIFDFKQNIFENIKEHEIENINLTSKASKAVRNLSICSGMYETVKEKINSYLAINLTSENATKDIEDIFVFQQIVEKEKKSHKKQQEQRIYTIEEIIQSSQNILISGKAESGKSTNLNMITLYCLREYTDYIPIYISSSELMNVDSERHFIAKVAEYLDKNYGKNKFNINQMIKEKRFLFLLDDLHLLQNEFIKKIVSLNNRIIATSTVELQHKLETAIENLSKQDDYFENFLKLELKAFRKKDQQNLTSNIVANSHSSRIANSVHKTIVNLRLPSSPFITTLLIWMHTEKIDIKENKPEIIDVFLDYLLEKTDLSKSFQGKFTFSDKKNLLAMISHEFYKQKSFAIKEDIILNCIISHISKFGFDINSKDILDYFYKRKIFFINNGLVMFSYRVFYYYFISLYMIKHRDFTHEIMNNKVSILNMIDELKFYAAMKTDDKEFVTTLINFLNKSIFIKKLDKYILELPKLTSKFNDKLKKSNNLINQSIKSVTEQDEIIFESDEDKKFSDTIDEKRTESHERHVHNYNVEVQENDILYNKQLYKEEFLIINMVLSEFLKHLSTIDIADKKEYISLAVKHYALIFNFWIKTLDKTALIKRLISKRTQNNKIEEKELDSLIDFVKTYVFTILTSIVEDTLASPKMTKIYQQNIAEEDNLNNFYFYTVIESAVDEPNLINMLNHLIDNSNDKNIFKSLYYKMLHNYLDKDYNGTTKSELKEILVKLNMINGIGKKAISTKREYQHHFQKGLKNVDKHLKIGRLFI